MSARPVRPVRSASSLLGVLFLLSLLALPRAARSAGPVFNSANGHWYEAVVVAGGINWSSAHSAAQARTHQGLAGHLITVTSAAEGQFIRANLPEAASGALYWMGGFQPSGSPEPSGGWRWVTGEAWLYTEWNSGEPNNVNGGEESLSFTTNAKWNDDKGSSNGTGYVVEYEDLSAGLPGAPFALSVAAVATGRLDLAWQDGSLNETGFEIERKPEGGSFSLLTTAAANSTSYRDSTVTVGTVYTYRVRAVNANGASQYSNEAAARARRVVSFLAPASLSVSTPIAVGTADYDADGKLDLAVGTDPNVGLCWGRGDGTFEPPTLFAVSPVPTTAWLTPIAVDVDRDGRLDLVCSVGDRNAVVVRLNQGSRSFAPPADYPAGNFPAGVAAGDFNGDGWPDLAVPVHRANQMGVLLNRGDGTFGAPTFYSGGGFPAKIVTADFNRDGRLDLAMSNYTSGDVRVYRGNGLGAFAPYATYGVGTYPAEVVKGDFNGDGLADLAAANTFGSSVSALIGNGAGDFTVMPAFTTDGSPHLMRAGDLDLDGFDDLATPCYANDTLNVLQSDGTGRFHPRLVLPSGGKNPRNVALGDFNRDGQLDVAVANLDSNVVAIFLNSTLPPPAPSAPTDLRAAALSQTAVRLTWTDTSSNESGFQIERKTGAGSFAPRGTVGANVTTVDDTELTAATTYTYRVQAFNTGGSSAYSNEAAVTTLPDPPAPPTNLAATVVSSTELALSWTDGGTGETGFKIERRSGDAAFMQVGTAAADAVSFRDTGLAPATLYVYRVRATNAGGDSSYSNEASGTTFPLPPEPPSALAVEVVSSSALRLSWRDNSATETGFQIQRRTGADPFAPLGMTAADVTTYADEGLQPVTRYVYRVRAANAGGESAFSEEAAGTTLPLPPGFPSDLTGTAVSQTRIDLAWRDASENETGFRIERRAEGTPFAPIDTVGANVTSYPSTGLTAATRYTYRVRAINAGGDSEPSNEASATTLPDPPAPPDSLTVTVQSATALRLAWRDTGTAETGFRIERRGMTGDFAPLAEVGANVTTCVDEGLAPGGTFTYRVRAFNAGGASEPSNEASATLPARGGKLSVPGALPFGRVRVGRSVRKSLLLRNLTRRESLWVSVETPAGPGPFTLEGGARSVTLGPNRSVRLFLRFTPAEKGPASGSMLIRSSDPGRPAVTVRLTGSGG